MEKERLQIGYLEVQNRPLVNGTGTLLLGEAYPNSNPSGFITRQNVVFTTGNQTISDLKDFSTRPTVNTIPVALSGEAASNIEQFVKNDYGFTLYKGQPVYVSGSNGNNILIHPASNSGEGTSSKTFGLLKQTLLNNEQGYVVTEGPLLNVDTSMAVEGDPIWLGPTGNLIYGLANKPQAPQHLVSLGFVERAHQNQGKIFVKVQNGYELDELHDVRIINKQNSDIIIYNSGSGLWLNSGVDFGNFYTKDNPSGFITGIDLSNYITGAVVRPSETGNFITIDQTGNFYSAFNPSGYITGVDLSNYITKTNGEFTNRPTVNGTGILLSGEGGGTAILPDTIVHTTGDQTISGTKNFANVTETFLRLGIINQTVNFPLNSGMNFILPLTTGITGITFSNVPSNIYSFTLRVDYSGSHAIIWPVGLGGVLWPNNTAPTLTTTASREDFFSFLTYTSGQEFFGFNIGQNYSGIY